MPFVSYPLSYTQHVGATEEEREQADKNYWARNRVWFFKQIRQLEADFIVFGGTSGTIYRHGRLSEFPDEAELRTIGLGTNEVPIAWTKTFSIEELVA